MQTLLFVFVIFISLHWSCGQNLVGTHLVNGTYGNGIATIRSETNCTIRLFGVGLDTAGARVAFASERLKHGQRCDDQKDTDAFYLHSAVSTSALISIRLIVIESTVYYYCVKWNDSSYFFHQGTEKWLALQVNPSVSGERTTLLPIPLQIAFICILVLLSGLFSGLNLGLMSIDPLELQILMKSGSEAEQKYSTMIYPIRRFGNFLLCTLLLGNVLVNNTLTIFLGELTSGTIAIVCSTAAIVILGEIVPQALCSRYALPVGAHFLWITKVFMVLTFVVSYPASKLLDCLLGQEIGTVYDRKKLLEMLKVTQPYNDLVKNEVKIIEGALELRTKMVKEAMTPIDDCFMIDINSVLDFETMHQIMRTGFTRIPVYENSRDNLVSILFVKDLAFVDPDDCMPLKTVCKFYQHLVHFIDDDITLDKVLEQFKTGCFHMAIAKKDACDEGAPCELVGIITLEDIIEEIIKAEIVDETDVYTDNRRKTLNLARQKEPLDLSLFADGLENNRNVLTPQLLLAAHRFLLAEVEPFKTVSDKVLLKLLKSDTVCLIISKHLDSSAEKRKIFRKDVPADFFVLILEGQVKVVVGKESLEFQGGPFSFYGVPALSLPPTVLRKVSAVTAASSSPVGSVAETVADTTGSANINVNDITVGASQIFRPDYDLIALTDIKYVKITRKQYWRAMNATVMAELGQDEATGERESLIEGLKIRRTASKRSIALPSDGAQSYYVVNRDIDNLDKDGQRRNTMSPEHLMAIAAQYATVAGDRMRPTSIKRSFSISAERALRSSQQDSQSQSSGRLFNQHRQVSPSPNERLSQTNVDLVEESSGASAATKNSSK